MGGPLWASITARAANSIVEGVHSQLVSRGAYGTDEPAVAANATATNEFISQLQFSSAKSIRTSTITLSSFNVLAAAVTLACVIWDSYLNAKREDPKWTWSNLRWSFISTSHIYPFILSLGIMIQGILFAVAQSRGLGALLIKDCIPVSQMMMPATFIVPFIQLVFGVEIAVRVLPPRAFSPMQPWSVPTYLFIIVAGLLGLYGATLGMPPPDECYASLFWYTQTWRPVTYGLLVAITSILAVAGVAVFFQVRQNTVRCNKERMTASNMVYYITIAVISNALLIPFFHSITFASKEDSANPPMELSTVASIVANLSGLMTGGLYLFLRGGRKSNLTSNSHDVLDFKEKWMKPLNVDLAAGNRSGNEQTYSYSTFTSSDFGGPPKSDLYRPDLQSKTAPTGDAVDKETWPGTFRPDSLKQERVASQHASGYFNRVPSAKPAGDMSCLLPSTTYTPTVGSQPPTPKQEELLMPPPLFHPPEQGRHQRNSSVGSAQTVQIGLRLSNMNSEPPSCPTVPPAFRTSPLASPTAAQTPPPTAYSEPSANSQESLGNNFYKGLPDSPKKSPTTTQNIGEQETTCQLSPTVYSPEASPTKPKRTRTRLASPRGVGFQMAKTDRSGRTTPLASPRPPMSARSNPKTGNGWI